MEEYLPGPHRQPARLPDPDHRRRAGDRADPDREARPRGPLRRPRPRRAHADPDRARRSSTPSATPPAPTLDRVPALPRPRPRRDPQRGDGDDDRPRRGLQDFIPVANLESSRFPPTGGKQAKKPCAHRALLPAAKAARGRKAAPRAPARPMNAPDKLPLRGLPGAVLHRPRPDRRLRPLHEPRRPHRPHRPDDRARPHARRRPPDRALRRRRLGRHPRPLPDRHRRRHHLPRLQARPLHRVAARSRAPTSSPSSPRRSSPTAASR